MKQGEQAWLLGGDKGNHEYANIRYMSLKGEPAKYIVKDGYSRLGGIELLHIAVDGDGARLTWSQGFRTLIPPGWYQVTYRV